MSTPSSTPTLSVIVVSFNRPIFLERCLSSLEDQDHREGIEYLVVRNEPEGVGGTEELKERFPGFRWIASNDNVPRIRGIGMSESIGEVIALIEDDCVADENWVRNVREAHKSPSAAIAGIIKPGNYRSNLDWAVYFSEYGRFMTPSSNGAASALPGTNVSYKRTALENLSGRAGEVVDQFGSNGFYEAFSHQALLRVGATMERVSMLVVTNIKVWERREALESRYHHARGYAAMRTQKAPASVRVAYMLAAPLLPLLQMFRISKQVLGRRGLGAKLVQSMPWIIGLSLSWAIGEFTGYLLGPGDSLDHWR